MNNIYQERADYYKKRLEVEGKEEQARIYYEQKIKAFETLAGMSDTDIRELFSTGAFDFIVKGYLLKAMDNAGVNPETITETMQHLHYLLAEFLPEEAQKFYYDSKY